jgi:hypothetical protein
MGSSWTLFLAFGMPAMTMSRQPDKKEALKNGQLDMLVFGMPKIFREFLW